ncbi:MAG: DEAD/DEAH box helicase [Candidatus Aenigmarchaeota archaeon]|nr:DEAD/DEAH box helicase [Candidatus Aenigmarchaeota archaeon]
MPLPTLLVKGSLVGEGLENYQPLNYITQWLEEKMRIKNENISMADRLLFLVSKTGSGKSTSFPTKLHTEFFGRTQKNIICTQPRVLTAIDIPKSIVKEKWAADQGFVLGKNIGYQTKNFVEKPIRGLVYTTIGVLAQQLKNQSDKWMCDNYSFIIIDECHVKPPELDLVIYRTRSLLQRNLGKLQCPFLILTSATFRVDDYAAYFGLGAKNIISVAGISFPIEKKFLEFGSNDFIDDVGKVVNKIHQDNPNDDSENCDILVFLPGGGEANDVKRILSNSAINEEIKVLAIDSAAVKMQNDDYRLINVKASDIEGNFKRKVILSTNVAETGLTLDYLKYVVDSGWNRAMEFNPNYGIHGLITKPATRSMVTQRMGRAGRKNPGEFHPIYTQNVLSNLQANEIPEIYNTDISTLMLDMYSIASTDTKDGVFDINNLDLIDQPTRDSVRHANDLLFSLGMITTLDDKVVVSEIGVIVNKLLFMPNDDIRIPAARMVLAGFAWNVSIVDLITIIAFLDVKEKSYMPAKNLIDILRTSGPAYLMQDTSERSLWKFKTIICDEFIEPLFVFSAFKANIMKQPQKWCIENGINYKAMIEIAKIRDNIIEQFLGLNINVFVGISILDMLEEDFMEGLVNLKQCIYEGFKMNLCQWDDQKNGYVQVIHSDLMLKMPGMFSSPTYKAIDKLFDIGVKNSERSLGRGERSLGKNERSLARGEHDRTFRPKFIIPNKLTLKLKSIQSSIYIATCDKISILDGYIHPDMTFFYV